jgi:alkanesulfonate monooxygenase SsuD/methylene tetrahydromethanopterin reductase-like flavin-dependent oxidoreductase (luciferase family)
MKFGLYSSTANPPRGEHHQDRDGFLPSPLIVATAVAARTRTLRVGTSVHLAEDVITLDLVSKGRVVLGVGIGYQPSDFKAFAVAMEERLARRASRSSRRR